MAERETIPVLYDFASTICYVAHRVTGRMQADLDALAIDLVWRPLDLARLSGWRRGAAVEGPPRENALRVARELEVEVRMPAFWIDSRGAHAVALALAGGPREAAWRERVWSAIFEEGRDVGEPDELERLGADLGIDVPALARELGPLESETRAARERGVTGVPSFVLGEFPFAGIQEPETMRSLLGRYVSRKRG